MLRGGLFYARASLCLPASDTAAAALSRIIHVCCASRRPVLLNAYVRPKMGLGNPVNQVYILQKIIRHRA